MSKASNLNKEFEDDWRIELVGFFPHLENNKMNDLRKLLPKSNIEAQTDSVLELSSQPYSSKEEAVKDANAIFKQAKLIAPHGYVDVIEAITMDRFKTIDW